MAFEFTRNGQPMAFGDFQEVVVIEHPEKPGREAFNEEQTITQPARALLEWSDEELLLRGIVRAEVPDPEPPPPRRTIPKSVVQARVNERGKWADVAALLFTAGLPNIYYARWFAPDWPNVYFDDEGLLLILGQAGCTAEDIAYITAELAPGETAI